MSRYLDGVDVIGAHRKPVSSTMSVKEAKRLISASLDVLYAQDQDNSHVSELIRQLKSMERSLEADHVPDPIPLTAASLLRMTANDAMGTSTHTIIGGERWGTEVSDTGTEMANYGTDTEDEVVGMFDIGAAQLKMNALSPVTVGAAKALIHGGQQVMAVANASAKQP